MPFPAELPELSVQSSVITGKLNLELNAIFHISSHRFNLCILFPCIILGFFLYFTLSWGSAQFLEDNLKSDTTNTDDAVYLRDPSSQPNVWKKYGCYVLTTMHKAHLVRGNLLDDIHMGAAQALLKE